VRPAAARQPPMRVNVKVAIRSHRPAGAREFAKIVDELATDDAVFTSPAQGHLIVAHYEVVGKGVKDSSVP
jgi:hypothetical protein